VKPPAWVWLLPVIPVLSATVLRVGSLREWPPSRLLPLSYGHSTVLWFSLVVAAYIYGYTRPLAVAPFVVALLVSLLARVTLHICSWYDSDRQAAVTTRIPRKSVLVYTVVSFEIPLIVLSLAFLGKGSHDWRLVVALFVTFQAVLLVLFYATWSRISEN
jgi:phosphoglycerol transferase MdoB-like AlkP superfamily enzyme